jgi:hypothetical protein
MNFLDKITRTAAALLVASLIVTFISACAKTVSNMEITHMVTENQTYGHRRGGVS